MHLYGSFYIFQAGLFRLSLDVSLARLKATTETAAVIDLLTSFSYTTFGLCRFNNQIKSIVWSWNFWTLKCESTNSNVMYPVICVHFSTVRGTFIAVRE